MMPLHDDNPARIVPWVTYSLLAACIAGFLWQLSLGDANQQTIYGLGVIPAVLFDVKSLHPDLQILPAWMTIFSSLFLHGSWMHLIGNMLFLWIFGNNVEDAMGHRRFIVFYLLCGFAAAMAQSLPDTASEIPMIGASGAISGVLGAYLLLYPHARVLVLIPLGIVFFTHWLAAYWVLGLWFLLQLFSTLAMSTGQQGGIAFAAHAGGFVAGLALIPFFKHRSVPLLAPARRH